VEPSGRMQVLDPGDLLVAAVKESDAGHYTCIRANEAGEVHASAFLTVLGEGKTRNSFRRFHAFVTFQVIKCNTRMCVCMIQGKLYS
jgi:hypothetical protein